jgi:hypothetical protein
VLTILPMQLQVGDRFTDEEGEWEAINRSFSGSKDLRAET